MGAGDAWKGGGRMERRVFVLRAVHCLGLGV